MKSETLNKVNDALVRLESGNYGNCFDCGEEIAEKRLRALPFASAARIARRPRRPPSSASVSSPPGAARARFFMDM